MNRIGRNYLDSIHSCAVTAYSYCLYWRLWPTLSLPSPLCLHQNSCLWWWMRRPQNLNWNIWFTPKNYTQPHTHIPFGAVNFWGMRNGRDKRTVKLLSTWRNRGDTRHDQMDESEYSLFVFAFSNRREMRRRNRKKRWTRTMHRCAMYDVAAGRCRLHDAHGRSEVGRDEREHSNWFPFSIKFLSFVFVSF